MKISEKLDKKIQNSVEHQEFDDGYYAGHADGANLLRPLLLEMVEVLYKINEDDNNCKAIGGHSVDIQDHIKGINAVLLKFEEFLK